MTPPLVLLDPAQEDEQVAGGVVSVVAQAHRPLDRGVGDADLPGSSRGRDDAPEPSRYPQGIPQRQVAVEVCFSSFH